MAITGFRVRRGVGGSRVGILEGRLLWADGESGLVEPRQGWEQPQRDKDLGKAVITPEATLKPRGADRVTEHTAVGGHRFPRGWCGCGGCCWK